MPQLSPTGDGQRRPHNGHDDRKVPEARDAMHKKGINEEKGDSLLRVDGLELDCLISVRPPARRAAAVEVLLDVVPAELADLQEFACKRQGN